MFIYSQMPKIFKELALMNASPSAQATLTACKGGVLMQQCDGGSEDVE